MTNESTRQQLIQLFQETAPVHHHAYKDTDGEDPEWPLWYANYMQKRLNTILNGKLTRSKVVQMLVSASEEQEANEPNADWAEYYTDYFLKHYPQPE